MNFRFGGTFFKQTARQFFAKPVMSAPLKGRGFCTVALQMQDLEHKRMTQMSLSNNYLQLENLSRLLEKSRLQQAIDQLVKVIDGIYIHKQITVQISIIDGTKQDIIHYDSATS